MHKAITCLLTLALVALTPAHAATVKAGAKCSKAGSSATVSGKKFTCIKTGSKLIWNKGVAIKPASDIKIGMCPPKAAADKNPGLTQLRANALLTMSEADAEDCAMKIGWGFRVGQRDEELFMLTKDYRLDRVTVTMMKGVVTKVDIG